MSVAAPGQTFKATARTVSDVVTVEGRGLHGGDPAKVRVHPEQAGHGRWLRVGRSRWRLGIGNARAPGGCTAVGPVRTVEHLLAAFVLRGVTDATVEVEGTEIPALDGSALPWVEYLGTPVATGVVDGWRLGEVGPVRAAGGVARIQPDPCLILSVAIDFGPGLRQELVVGREGLLEIAGARTFFPHARLDRLLETGLGRGARPGGVVVWGPRGPLVPLRFPDEPVRHKALDLLGDLALLDVPVVGRIHVERGSHALHQALVRACGRPPSRSD